MGHVDLPEAERICRNSLAGLGHPRRVAHGDARAPPQAVRVPPVPGPAGGGRGTAPRGRGAAAKYPTDSDPVGTVYITENLANMLRWRGSLDEAEAVGAGVDRGRRCHPSLPAVAYWRPDEASRPVWPPHGMTWTAQTPRGQRCCRMPGATSAADTAYMRGGPSGHAEIPTPRRKFAEALPRCGGSCSTWRSPPRSRGPTW